MLVRPDLVLRIHIQFKPANLSRFPVVSAIISVKHPLPVFVGFFDDLLHLDIMLVGGLVERNYRKVACSCECQDIVAVLELYKLFGLTGWSGGCLRVFSHNHAIHEASCDAKCAHGQITSREHIYLSSVLKLLNFKLLPI